MKIENTIGGAIIATTQSKWLQRAMMTLAILTTLLVLPGCDRSSDSGHHGNHDNHRN